MRLWYLSHRRPAKAQAMLVSPEPSLFAHMKYGRRRSRDQTKHQTSSPHWMAAHAHLKKEFTEDEKYQNLMSWLINVVLYASVLTRANTSCKIMQASAYSYADCKLRYGDANVKL